MSPPCDDKEKQACEQRHQEFSKAQLEFAIASKLQWVILAVLIAGLVNNLMK